MVSAQQRQVYKGRETALMDAARNGHLSAVKTLVKEMRASVHACDNFGRNALIHALRLPLKRNTILRQNKNIELIVSFLLDCGADVTGRDENGKTSLILAAERADCSDIFQQSLQFSSFTIIWTDQGIPLSNPAPGNKGLIQPHNRKVEHHTGAIHLLLTNHVALIDADDKVLLADFDKSSSFAEGQRELIIKEDLEALFLNTNIVLTVFQLSTLFCCFFS
uniref:Uncharacterized protein n=1 Tax=Gopherus agassizii TaxID=38772 RepID=A0A452GNI0_9SAUR